MQMRIWNSYLIPREGVVALQEVWSETKLLCDMDFQGIVLVPALWSKFFIDVCDEIPLVPKREICSLKT